MSDTIRTRTGKQQRKQTREQNSKTDLAVNMAMLGLWCQEGGEVNEFTESKQTAKTKG